MLADDLDVALVDQRLEHLHLAVAQQPRIVVSGGAAQQEVVALGRQFDHALCLQLAHLHVVEGHVAVDVGVQDQAVIRYDLDALLLGAGNGVAQHLGVERHDHEHVDVLRDQVLDLGDLLGLIGVGRLHVDGGAQLLGSVDKVIAVMRPALDTQVVDREADHRRFLAGMGRRCGKAQDRRSGNGVQYTGNHERSPVVHKGVLRT